MPIHPTAIIGNNVIVDPSNDIGPYVIIEENVQLGKNNRIMAHAFLGQGTMLGDGNKIHPGAAIGGIPQDINFKEDIKTHVLMGNDNIFREHCTVHRSTNPQHPTTIGNSSFFMCGSHIAHDCIVGNHVIMANDTAMGGHVKIQDRVFIGGGSMIHQFCQIGALTMIAGNSRISMDVPPFVIAGELNQVWGINRVGLNRANLQQETIKEIREVYRMYFHTPRNGVLDRIRERGFKSKEIQDFIYFIENSTRGICVSKTKAHAT
ncbi:MAG TPA: acyl-ACP--UDP-N-acetylglucosamine O-acyltransferase [Planctomycetota bacterium]|nr:acyl-ACP--UDP-N-acetylglucosamine O-acyltransferase [Planctomycetota bacterium]